MKLFGTLILSLIGFFSISVILLAISSRLNLPGAPMIFLVQSGSMEPAIRVGDLILVVSQSHYSSKEIITFYDSHHRIVTHRLMDNKNNLFITQGDANRTPDSETISSSQIIGRVKLIIPKIGMLVNFAHTRSGIILLVVIPAIIIIIDEILKLVTHLSR